MLYFREILLNLPKYGSRRNMLFAGIEPVHKLQIVDVYASQQMSLGNRGGKYFGEGIFLFYGSRQNIVRVFRGGAQSPGRAAPDNTGSVIQGNTQAAAQVVFFYQPVLDEFCAHQFPDQRCG
ncbi:MAG: hypothetical protein BWY09_03054 [Candidatus Hydrogenedentes bacterium ADurb.Bin179]|nr:MAG: hypothetical protein BWY09_03054 [Candidatus Hydrogenedentes bacterium ADurb.Bin179]